MAQTTIISRAYQASDDLETLKNFFTSARSIAGHHTGFLHAGDVLWRMFSNDDVEPEQNIRFWQCRDVAGNVSTGNVVGVAWLMFDEELEIHVHPNLPDDAVATVTQQMLEWAEALTKEDILTSVTPDNEQVIKVLEQMGYERDDFEQFIYLRDLSTPIPDIKLPLGFTVRHVLEDEFEERVETHRDVWQPSEFTLEKYQRIRAANGYKPELDLVVASSNGTFVSYCIVWLEDGVGEFEPVGTRSTFRKQGFGKALITEGFNRLKALGAHTATVYSYPENRTFYEACGFQVVNRWVGFKKEQGKQSNTEVSNQ